MKTKNQVDRASNVASRRDFAARTFFTALILATAAISIEAGERTGAAYAIRPFQTNIPEAIVAAQRQRVTETRWPDQETAIGRAVRAETGTPHDLSPELTPSSASPFIESRQLQPQPRSFTWKITPSRGGTITTENQ